MSKPKLIRITTVPISLEKLLEGQLQYMSNFFEVIALSSDKKRLMVYGNEKNIRTFFLPLTRTITPFMDLKAIWKLYCFLRKEKPAIVHTHTPKAGMVGMIASKLAGVPIRLHTVAGLPLLEIKGAKRAILNFVEKITYACATRIYPNSKGLKKIILTQNFTSEEKLKIIGTGSSNGIDTASFNPELFSEETKQSLREKYNLAVTDFVLLFVGRLVSDKGINELVQAFKILNTEFKNKHLKLLLVGPFEAELDELHQQTIEEIETNPHIITTGYQQDVRPYFSIGNLLVFPSYREGFPNVVMQAGAMGLPAIVSNINGCNEIIIERKNGILIPVKDTNAIIEAVNLLLNHTFLYNKLKNNSRQLIVDRYQRQAIWSVLLQEYQHLIKEKLKDSVN